MSSALSAVTYTSVYTDSEPGRVFWGADEEISDGDPDYVPACIPKYIPLEDEHVFPAEEQPLPLVDSPTFESPGYITESDPEEDLVEYEDDESEDGSVDYPMDEGDDGYDDDGDSSGDNTDDEDADEDEEDEEDEDEHPVIHHPSTYFYHWCLDQLSASASIRPSPESEVKRLLAMTTPSSSPPISLSPPSGGERLARCTAPPAYLSPPPVPSLLPPSSGCPTQIQTLKITSTQALIDAVTAALPSPPPPPHYHHLLYITTIDHPAEAIPEVAPMTVEEVNTRVIELAELYERDTHDLYALLEDAQDGRTRISQQVAMDSQRVDLLMGDRMTLQETVWIVEEEAYASREAWAHSIGLSQATHQELRTT
ncbi:hypothetical protein Tco_1036705 [Tanacetum coccineum]